MLREIGLRQSSQNEDEWIIYLSPISRFDVVESYSTGQSSKVTSVVAGLGSVLTSSSNGAITAHHPDRLYDCSVS